MSKGVRKIMLSLIGCVRVSKGIISHWLSNNDIITFNFNEIMTWVITYIRMTDEHCTRNKLCEANSPFKICCAYLSEWGQSNNRRASVGVSRVGGDSTDDWLSEKWRNPFVYKMFENYKMLWNLLISFVRVNGETLLRALDPALRIFRVQWQNQCFCFTASSHSVQVYFFTSSLLSTKRSIDYKLR